MLALGPKTCDITAVSLIMFVVLSDLVATAGNLGSGCRRPADCIAGCLNCAASGCFAGFGCRCCFGTALLR